MYELIVYNWRVYKAHSYTPKGMNLTIGDVYFTSQRESDPSQDIEHLMDFNERVRLFFLA